MCSIERFEFIDNNNELAIMFNYDDRGWIEVIIIITQQKKKTTMRLNIKIFIILSTMIIIIT